MGTKCRLILFFSLIFSTFSFGQGRRCVGSSNCSACKNCTGCKYCNDYGGSCGVCGGGNGLKNNSSYNGSSSNQPSYQHSPSASYTLKKVKVKIANVRASPNSSSNVIGILNKNEIVMVLYVIGSWCCIKIGDVIGYMHITVF